MNTRIRRVLTASSFAALFVAFSALAAAPAPQTRSLSLDCAQRNLPSLATVGAWYGTNNAGQAYELRSKLMGTIRRACHASPDGRVTLRVPDKSATAEFVAQTSSH